MKHVIAMVSDFFYPNMGGVESHIYQLSQCVIARGHRVVVITHEYEGYTGVRYLTNCLKVYYLPLVVMYNQCILPTYFSGIPLLRSVLLHEKITIVHGHSAFSTLAHETMCLAKVLGIHSVFTDHSLFGFADGSSIITNKLLEISLIDTHHVVCVSHTSKENTVLRAKLDPHNVYVIPNAVDATKFRPDPTKRNPDRITIVVMSRLVYRKGLDLLAGLIPEICGRHPDVDFLIGGDGPKRLLLEETRERFELHDRVTLLGAVAHHNVRDVLVRGNIFVNTSLTEAFCIAIVEAASCGLRVVSTRVGGVPEVLPPHLILLADPSVPSLIEQIETAIETERRGLGKDAFAMHDEVAAMYTWQQVAERTEKLYDDAAIRPKPIVRDYMHNLRRVGPIAGPIFLLVTLASHLICRLLDYFCPVRVLPDQKKQR